MADTPTPGGPIAVAGRHFAPYAPVFGGAVNSMAIQRERMTRGDRLDRYREGQIAYGQRAQRGGRLVH